MVLVIGAGLFLDTLRNLETLRLGMDTTNIVAAEITLRQPYGQFPASAEFFERLETGLSSLPGVSGVAVSDSLPPTGGERARQFFDISVEGRPPFPRGTGGLVGWRIVSPGYFQMLGIPILEGRGFEPSDQDAQTAAIVVSKKLADRLFAGQNAVGQHLQFPVPSGLWYTVVGVAGDVKYLNESGRVGRTDPEYYVARKRLPALATVPEGADRHAFFLVRSPETGIVFDENAVVKKSNENPVYYIQNAHVRCAGIARQAGGAAHRPAVAARAGRAVGHAQRTHTQTFDRGGVPEVHACGERGLLGTRQIRGR